MTGRPITVVLETTKAVRIKKWKVKEGVLVSNRQIIFIYDVLTALSNDLNLYYKSTQVGTVRKVVAKEGDIVIPGEVLLELEECSHQTVMKDMCAECGADLRKNEQMPSNASVPMVHTIPELKVSEEQAQIIGKADENRLISDRKLVLLVDLDQTLIHTTNDNIPPNLKDVYHFRLYGHMSPWYHTRIRPRTNEFLSEVSKYYELHICTFGARNYAHTIAMFLDPDGKYFSHRILSRDECFSPNSKTANLKALFPCGDNMVCIIDDREDVWNYAPNLIHVKPYHFFKHTGDINAPPGLTKNENDEIDGFDFTDIGNLPKNELQEKSGEDDSLKKVTTGNNLDRFKVEASVESTTEKDTEDEEEKALSMKPKTQHEVRTEDIEKVASDLQLSEDDSDDVVIGFEESKKNTTTLTSAEEPTHDNETQVCGNERGKKLDENGETIKLEKVETATESNNTTDVLANKGQEQNEGDKKEKYIPSDAADLIEIEDPDDYLLYLEDILKNIHKHYYEEYDRLKSSDANSAIPDLKEVIPFVKRQVLKDCHLVFSGLVPSYVPLQQSTAYMVAVSLGATVSPDISPKCTHLVAARPGTAKVNSSRRQKGIFIVTPLWLWHCAERWKKPDERLYPLGRGSLASRVPPAHCASPEHNRNSRSEQYLPALRSRTPSGRFIDTINPLLTFSSEDMKIMDQEVEDLFKEDDDDETESEIEKFFNIKSPSKVPEIEDSSTTSSEDWLSGGSHPKGWSERKTRKRQADTTTCTETEYDEESPSVKFRRGEALPSDLDLGEDSQDIAGSDEAIDDGEWNMMGAALEREFLSEE